VEKATFHKIKRPMIERILASSQASHQRLAFQSAGVPLDSQRAYELASEGMVRPSTTTDPVVYSLKLLDFDLPNFQIEVKVINETDEYLATLIHELGLKLNTVAACSKIHCVKYGPFELNRALLVKHWTLDNIIANLRENASILKEFQLNIRDPIVRTQHQATENTEVTDERERKSTLHDAFTTTFSR
jgi:tRNA U55 pseudouridine synthase TruB